MRIAVVAGLWILIAGSAHAQGVARRYLAPPTDGLSLPTTPLAGEHDARAVVANPGGLALVRGAELALGLTVEDADVAARSGQGAAAYGATTVGGGLLPRLGVGLGLEWLRPARDRFSPEPDQPFRATLAVARALGRAAGLGLAWHHFHGDGALRGVDAFDLGVSTRLGNHAAFGATLRDVATPAIGGAQVARRYAGELALRPLGTDRLDLAIGGQIDEAHGDLDGWLRASLRVVDGVYLHAAAESRALRWLDDGDPAEHTGRDLRGTLGIELSFGEVGVTTLASGVRDAGGRGRALGGTVMARFASEGPRSLLGPRDHLERVDLAGELGVRAITSLVVRLRAIARDPSARGVVVTFDGLASGWAALEELRGELLAIRRAGKPVFAYLVTGSSRDYFVATAADQIFLDPAGGLRLVGMSATTMYFRGAFDLVGVVPQFDKIAEYKSAPEQFTERGPSQAAAQMRGELYDALWERWVAAVAEGRRLTPAQVRAVVDAGPYTAGDLAADPRLVDVVAAPDEVSRRIAERIGGALPIGGPEPARPAAWERPAVAIVYIDGDITDGKSQTIPGLGRTLAGGQTVVAALAAARSDPRIGAIVLRIDSPGGSSLASELIAREVFATRGVKPIVCSMANVAASGGYFAAAGCDLIFAEPMTITGSIGIFYGKFDLGGLARKLGVTFDTERRGQRADLDSMYRPYTEEERAALKDKLRYLYGRFVGAVAAGRGLEPAAVDAVGRGHVYAGAQAQAHRLVDRLGGLGDALDEAKRRLGVSTETAVELVELPGRAPGVFAALIELLGGARSAGPSIAELPAVRQLLDGVPASILVAPGVAQARLPFEIRWDQ